MRAGTHLLLVFPEIATRLNFAMNLRTWSSDENGDRDASCIRVYTWLSNIEDQAVYEMGVVHVRQRKMHRRKGRS